MTKDTGATPNWWPNLSDEETDRLRNELMEIYAKMWRRGLPKALKVFEVTLKSGGMFEVVVEDDFDWDALLSLGRADWDLRRFEHTDPEHDGHGGILWWGALRYLRGSEIAAIKERVLTARGKREGARIQ